VENVVKKAVIVISLVEESAEVANEEVEKDILNELSKEPTRIPWLKEVQKVTVTEE
jgi:DNA-directed RNA polymerase subunit H (RpoH/RPB5)